MAEGLSYDIVIIRNIDFNNIYAGHFWEQNNVPIIITRAVTEFDPSLLLRLKEKRVLVAGGHYGDNILSLTAVAEHVTVICGPHDVADSGAIMPRNYIRVVMDEGKGFLSWSLSQLAMLVTNPIVRKVAALLDEFIFSVPSNDAIKFKAGLKTGLQTLIHIRSHEDLERVISDGEAVLNDKSAVATVVYF